MGTRDAESVCCHPICLVRQPQDESIIVGYYTSAEVHPQKLPASQPPLWGEKGVLWQEATVSIVPTQEI